MPNVSNLDVAVSSFWQLARHWNQGTKAKLELSCEDGSLHMQLSAVLGHPDQPHFPHPPPPHHPPPPPQPPLLTKKKTPSQLRRQEQRQCEARKKADEAMSKTHTTDSEKNVSDSDIVSKSKEGEIILEGEVEMPDVKQVVSSAETSSQFKCEECNYTNITVKGLAHHTRMKHRISQVDGTIDSDSEELKDSEPLTMELDENSVNYVSQTFKISSKELKSVEDIEKEILSTNIWKDIILSGFTVEEDLQDFKIEVSCSRQDFPE